jgi:hypothetical protein
VGIARGKSCASILVITRRKISLCEALPGRRPWPELELHGRPWELSGEGKEGEGEEGEGARLGCSWGGRHGEGVGAGGGRHGDSCCSSVRSLQAVCCAVHEEEEVEREKKRKRKEKKKKMWIFFSNLKFFGGK